ncbi:MAG: YggS family pyridoxal phosphate-dependent enzyme [Defluviitaleaceae bacterium]|nr:YggS family pyridoxal phosphate-dependent enzyme [Defluviitaleaceae bacterium]
MLNIARNLEQVYSNMRAACEKSERNFSDIKLVAVTKTQDADKISELVRLGVKDIGENRVQEMVEKHILIDTSVNWHMIGHLQTNKVKNIIDKTSLIHSVDSYKLIKEIDKQAKLHEKIMEILVEINIAGEESKYGIEPGMLNAFLEEVAGFENIMVKGLMCMAPNVENPEENRLYFRKMRQMFIDSGNFTANNINMKYLSMGMTNDYEIAIEEGANIIRVGTGIFGPRS